MVSYGASDSVVTGLKDGLLRRVCGYGAEPVADVDAPLGRLGRGEGRTVFAMRPSLEKETSGIDGSLELLGGLHEFGGRNSFEIWHGDRNRIVLTAEDDQADRFTDVVSVFFPNAEIEEIQLDPAPDGQQYVSAATASLRNDYYLQLRHPLGATQMRADPYEALLDRMNALPKSVRAVYQVVFTPAPEDWTTRTYLLVGSALTDDQSHPFVERQFSVDAMADEMERIGADSTASTLVRNQEDAFLANIRVLTFAPDPERARSAAATLGGCLADSYDDPLMDQGLADRGVPDYLLDQVVTAAANRTVYEQRERIGKYKRKPMLLTPSEATSLAHVPSTLEHDVYHFEGGNVEWVDPDEPTERDGHASANDPVDTDGSADADGPADAST